VEIEIDFSKCLGETSGDNEAGLVLGEVLGEVQIELWPELNDKGDKSIAPSSFCILTSRGLFTVIDNFSSLIV
jgi:hypothetical protein